MKISTDARPLALATAAMAGGAMAAAIVPMFRAERRWLRPLGERFNATVKRKLTAAGQAAKRELTSSIPVTPAAAQSTVERVIDEAVSA
ncbi:hypothetical protein FPZ24_04370 [Sphingomonas panacisoli]|uniref:Uncharacterized protein n=1 Tax=Sphingomonas panacisoli TaxID=1813879 RepID=A0A5B8LFW8_9SPHN|nr:hypothetical protein [Sphingomonas panacisoli]QDZ06806.1 hypothetical protein FPZ24_04370 [Sphingomonas panacisoli]